MLKYTGQNFQSYLIAYDGLAPEFFIQELNRLIVLYMENGLESFYLSYSEFLSQIRKQVEHQDGGHQHGETLRLYQFTVLFEAWGILITIAIITFICEIVIYRIRSRRLIPSEDISFI